MDAGTCTCTGTDAPGGPAVENEGRNIAPGPCTSSTHEALLATMATAAHAASVLLHCIGTSHCTSRRRVRALISGRGGRAARSVPVHSEVLCLLRVTRYVRVGELPAIAA